ncbi:hypothetical protein [Streptomyces heilongjiangensis]|uniref:Uncharacterized protein n=1 Tax=Streptomyces heilongjiangensis TaxID=945052 RepID=A0ABW1BG60_9ACTN|nr:hypothetical protein [Streptomyces heilongjiangensis]MDC2949620.1 hypothetical protein [Streptomyces heilongjiangensis]
MGVGVQQASGQSRSDDGVACRHRKDPGANSIFSSTVDMTDTLRQMVAQASELSPDDIAALSQHRRDNALRFGDYDTATLHIPPGPYDSALPLPVDGL